MVMQEQAIPGVLQTGYILAIQETIPTQAQALLICLNSFYSAGFIFKTDQGLRYVNPKR